jgi:SAM-dependent methyltransferase
MDKYIKKKTLETYLSLCTEVYDLSKPNPPEDAYAFYRDYAMNSNAPILEPMCGTGRFLLPLLEEGFDVHGFDASDNMLKALHVKAEAKNLKPLVWKGFVEDLDSPQKYDLIFIPSGSFGLITDLEDVKIALIKIYQHLNDDGILLFEAETPFANPNNSTDAIKNEWTQSSFQREDQKYIRLSTLTMPVIDNLSVTKCKYDLIEDDNIIHTELEEFKVRLYEQNQVKELLLAAGFKHIQALKAFDKSSAPTEQDESIVYECRK